jgi:arylsulfatase A-like enzyme
MRVDFTEPHPPYRPAAEFAQMYDPNEIAPWESFSEDFFNKPYIQKQMLHTWGMENYDWSRWAGIVARYYAYVSQLDDAIGCILDTLERSGRRDDTLIILSTDHGDMCGAHRMIDKHNVLYDDIVHVPLLMKWPRVLPRGRAIDAFVHNTLDIGPTLLEASGLPAPEYADGRSLFPLLSGDIPSDWRDCAVSTYNGQQFGLYTQRMVRDNEWKYIWNTADVDELYCLCTDPAELVNRIYDPHCNEILKNMRRKLHDILINEGDGLLKSHWMRDQLTGVTRKL